MNKHKIKVHIKFVSQYVIKIHIVTFNLEDWLQYIPFLEENKLKL